MSETLHVLLIDDKPNEAHSDGDTVVSRLEKALSELNLNGNYKICTVEDNSKENLRANFSNYSPDLVVLDWNFPEGRPTGAETLSLLREEFAFQGPILIHTITYDNFEKYVGRKGADSYYWWGSGVTGLKQVLERFVLRIYKTRDVPNFPYFETINDILDHYCYHPKVEIENLSEEQRRNSVDTVALITTAYYKRDSRDRGEIDTDNPMGEVIKRIRDFAAYDISMLILGPTGTGKELVARLFHYHQSRLGLEKHYEVAQHPSRHFMAVNCGAFSENLLNSELFGSLPGAFTDARERAGLFEQVSYSGNRPVEGGTVFLDEIALLSPQSQAFLLRVLQEKTVYRMGYDLAKFSNKGKQNININGVSIPTSKFGPIPVNFRLIAATNEDLRKKAVKGDFRLDLYHRIAENGIYLPSLRDRGREDFNLLFQYFLHKFNQDTENNIKLENSGGELSGVSRALLVYLWTNFPWNGNIRELESLVKVTATSNLARYGGEKFLSIEDVPEFWRKSYL